MLVEGGAYRTVGVPACLLPHCIGLVIPLVCGYPFRHGEDVHVVRSCGDRVVIPAAGEEKGQKKEDIICTSRNTSRFLTLLPPFPILCNLLPLCPLRSTPPLFLFSAPVIDTGLDHGIHVVGSKD